MQHFSQIIRKVCTLELFIIARSSQHSDMESEERTKARLGQRRDCDRECCGLESTEQSEVQFSKWKK